MLTKSVNHILEKAFNKWMDHRGKIMTVLWQSMVRIHIHLYIRVQGDKQDYSDGDARNRFRKQGKKKKI
jgi:hypothetical protein